MLCSIVSIVHAKDHARRIPTENLNRDVYLLAYYKLFSFHLFKNVTDHQESLLGESILTLHNVCAVYRGGGGGAAQWGMFSTPEDIMSTVGISWVHWGYSVRWGNIMSTPGDIMINVGEGHWENNWICMETPVYRTSPGVLMISLTLIMVSPQCTHGIPSVLNTPRCTQWYPPSVLNTPRCTQRYPPSVMKSEHPPVYCTDIMQGDFSRNSWS